MNGQNKNREKEEKLFRALSGVDEELLLRSEHNDGGEKQKADGKIHRFPLHYVSRIAAACLCLAVVGVLYLTMGNTKMADSTSADTAGNECAAPAAVYEAAQAENTAGEAEMAEVTAAMPENAVAEVTTDTGVSVSGNEAAAAGNSTETVKEEETLTKKQVRQLKRKMTTKGQ